VQQNEYDEWVSNKKAEANKYQTIKKVANNNK